MRRIVFIVAMALLFTLFCSGKKKEEAVTATTPQAPSKGMALTSAAFQNGASIPVKYGCSGTSTSPPLTFAGVPAEAKTLALIMEDPDAPSGLFTHWVVWNIPPGTTSVAEGASPAGGVEGTSSYRKTGYGPPCPPSGEHRYFFNLFALDTSLNLPPSTGRDQLQKAMMGHVLAQAQLMGKYRK